MSTLGDTITSIFNLVFLPAVSVYSMILKIVLECCFAVGVAFVCYILLIVLPQFLEAVAHQMANNGQLELKFGTSKIDSVGK